MIKLMGVKLISILSVSEREQGLVTGDGNYDDNKVTTPDNSVGTNTLNLMKARGEKLIKRDEEIRYAVCR